MGILRKSAQPGRGKKTWQFARPWETGAGMVSAWWLIVAFVGGGCMGVLMIALMRMSGGLPEQATANLPDLNGMPW
jgi:hypothetical protein